MRRSSFTGVSWVTCRRRNTTNIRALRGKRLASQERLAARYDVIVTEGAGSPAEINLREGDIANMGFAEAIDCPVILVADIERGGVFAHLVGTVALLSPSEQARVAGFVINRFRGDLGLLDSGLRWLERYTGKPVLGVLPYLPGLNLDAEDAIDRARGAADAGALKVIVPVLPRISNHTDFDLCGITHRWIYGTWVQERRRRRRTWSFCRVRRVCVRTWMAASSWLA